MTANTAEKLAKVRKYSTSLKRLFQLLFLMIALALAVETVLMLTGVEPFDRTVRIGQTAYGGDSIPAAIRLIAWLGTLLGLGILLKLDFHLIKLFGLYADGKIFTHDNVHEIRQIGVTLLLIPALWALGLLVPTFIPGEGLTTTITTDGTDPFTEIIAGTIVLVVSWIMDVGRELREEQDLVV